MHFACEKEKNLGGPERRPLLVELCSPTKYVQVLPLMSMKGTLFGSTVFADVIYFRFDHSGLQ